MQKTNYTLEQAYQKALDFVAEEQKIGIQKEKILHKTLKYYICNDESKHEIKIQKSSKGILYADICINNHIYEIQTRGFDKLRDKLNEFLNEFEVTIVYPIAYQKNIYKIEEKIEGPIKSPKKGKVLDAFKELYKIKHFLNHPNLKLEIILLDVDEYRYVTKKKHYKSSGYQREKQIPKRIQDIYYINSKEDYLSLIKTLNLPQLFTSTDLKKSAKISSSQASLVLNILNYLEVVQRVDKKGHSYIYQLKQ